VTPKPAPAAKPPVTPRPAAPKPKPSPKPTPTERDTTDAREQAERREQARAEAGKAREAAAARAGAAKASASDLAAYGATIYAEIARHRDSSGLAASGSVGVVFTVGASGRIVSHAITKSSGDAGLDGRVHAMMQAVQAPPPPGGSFHGRITIRFRGSE
jgi:protein TonB